MPSNYNPDSNAQPIGNWDTTFLSDRDVSAQVPINFVPHPGVYMTAACFGNNIFEDSATESCLSNLLASQIRRYVLDLYWDPLNRRFGLCPVEIPNLPNSNSTTSPVENSSGSGSFDYNRARQATVTSATNGTSTTASSSPRATFGVVQLDENTQLYQLGPYQCSATLTLSSIASVFDDYLESTANTIDAKIVSWVINLHAATTWQQPTVERAELTVDQLPNTTTSISSYLNSLDNTIYNPGILLVDRQNLNRSWYRRPSDNDYPLSNYLTTHLNKDGQLATHDGWPDENFIQVVRGKRLLIGFGNIDAAMTNYNTSADAASIFPPNYIQSIQDVPFETNGELSTGCFYNANGFSIGTVNNSWAAASIKTINPPDLGYAADNLTTCGFSQLLNVTINGATADKVPEPYQSFGNNAIFSWAYGQPADDGSNGSRDEDKFRCALMVANGTYRGHWKTHFCTKLYHVACREAQSPYRWSISAYAVPYASGKAACTGNTTFEVPRTGLENTYLYNKVIARARDDPSILDGIWVNFNSLDHVNCWVATGLNGTCPYYEDSSAVHSRQILIPAIAALIVLVLTVLTILVKCSTNARGSRTRRRGEGGWDYEGVPS